MRGHVREDCRQKSELDAALEGSPMSIRDPGQDGRSGRACARNARRRCCNICRVSQTMPPDEGRRYLARMKELTLGIHEQVEQSMSGDSGHEHHHWTRTARQADARSGGHGTVAAGHDAALNDLMARHAAAVFQFLCRMTGNEEDANDLAQETFVRVFKAAGRFAPGRNFPPGLFTIAANLARNHFRWRSRHPNLSLDAETAKRNKVSVTHCRRRHRRRTKRRWPSNVPQRCGRRRQFAGGYARGNRVVRMGGTQRGRGGGDSRIHPKGCGIAALSRPADFARTVEAMAVTCCRHPAGRSI